MPINRFKNDNSGKLLFVVRDPDQMYTHDEVCDLLEKAEALGFSLDAGSELGKLTVRELDVLVNRVQ